MQTSLSELESWYPHILNVIVGLWGTNELDEYLSQLIVADREDREGFPEMVMSELIMLHSFNETLINKKPTDVWLNRK
jgi:hypothetical protein